MTPGQRKNLERLLAPRHVAVVGGGDAAEAARQCAAFGFSGPIWAVNPRRKTMGGVPCYARVADLPEAPDLTFVAVPNMAALDVIAELSKSGAGGVVCYTAGFGELGGEEGKKLEKALKDAAGDLALTGPNCYGLLNYVRGVAVWPFGHGGRKVERGVAIISQSGMLGANLTMNQRSIPLAYVISSGNQSILRTEDYLEVLIDDPAVEAIGLYIEGIRDPEAFSRASLRALEKGIPIVALKTGTSEIGASLAVTHTGTLSGSDDVYQAFFDRLGIVRVDTPAALLETLKLFAAVEIPQGLKLAAFTCSGGDAALVADTGESVGLNLNQPSKNVSQKLKGLLPAIASISNPLDYTVPLWGDEENLKPVFEAMIGEYDLALLIQDYADPRAGIDNTPYMADTRAFINASKAAHIPAAVCSVLPETLPEEVREMLLEAGVAPLQGLSEGVAALAAVSKYGERRESILASGNIDRLVLLAESMPKGKAEVLDEWESKQLLSQYGVPIPKGQLACADEAASVAAELGFPVAIKAVHAELAHKTEAGAVRLGLRSESQVKDAITEMQAAIESHKPGLQVERFLVEQMMDKPVAELLVGVRREEKFGLVLVLATGGVLVEIMSDSRTLLLPTDRKTVSEAVASLKVAPILRGYRGQPAGDQAALVDAILAVADFAGAHHAVLEELDVNPLLVLEDGKGVCAVDALLRMTSDGVNLD